MSNSAIEIHDSTLGKIDVGEKDVVLWLTPAYIHRSEGVPGSDAGTGWVQDATITVSGGRIERAIEEVPVDLADGTLTVDQTDFYLLHLPLTHHGAIRLSLLTNSSETLVVTGTGIAIELQGEPTCVEEVR